MAVRDEAKFDPYSGPFDSKLRSVVVIKNMPHNHAALVTKIFEGPSWSVAQLHVNLYVRIYIVKSYQVVYFTAFLFYST